MTKFERYTITTSALALVVSLAAAILSPWLTYRYFDTAAKRRGTLIVTRAESTESGAGSELNATIHVRNIGHDPATNPRIIVVRTATNVAEPTVSVADRVPTRTGSADVVSEFSLSQSIAPNEAITITARGFIDHLYLRTDYQTLPLFQANQFGRFEPNK